ncbi:MAG: PPC domain-containing protein [Deltaproteobacteria bacterium]|nr:PPC domain-containing protein [Deltaproteobacteria bacterium]
MRVMLRGMMLATLVGQVACGGNGTRDRRECTTDADCVSDRPYCSGAGACVECLHTEQCGCHEFCDSEVCVPLGAPDAAHADNAHGNWRETPGTPGYTFVDSCTSNDHCNIGEICNPFTGGCITAALFQVSCGLDGKCDGNNACDPVSRKCLPAALCETSHNCCGIEEFACGSTVPKVCEHIRTECTPPAEDQITARCPFAPKNQDACTTGLWCSDLGRCVQCLCDADCGESTSLPRCYGPTGRCVSLDFCTAASECTTPGTACDRRNRICKPACSDDTQCEQGLEYCDPGDSVCRFLSERPCSPDAYEPNQTIEGAALNHSVLPVPAMDQSTVVEPLTICQDDLVDVFLMPLSHGDRIVVRGSTQMSVTATLTAYAADGQTTIATGAIDLVSEPLDFTASYSDTYYVVVEGNGVGEYSLEITRSAGTPCQDDFELPDHHGPNNRPADATPMNDSVAGAPSECPLTGALGGTHTVSCSGDAVRMCEGDVDYYVVEALPNSEVQVTISGFPGDLDLFLYGPFFPGDLIDTAPLADESIAGAGSSDMVRAFVRPAAKFLVQVERLSGGNTSYDLELKVTTGPSCSEDAYDALTAALSGTAPAPELVTDPAGMNDTLATAGFVDVAPVAPETLVRISGLVACKGDRDWFRVGVESGSNPGTLVDLPADMRFRATLVVDAKATGDKVTLAAGTDDTAMTLGSDDPFFPETQIFVPRTSGQALYLEVVGDAGNADVVQYHLDLEFITPANCSADSLDGGGGNNTPALATALAPLPGGTWPHLAYEFQSAAGLSLCTADDDWFKFPVPAGTSMLVTVSDFEPLIADVGLAVFNDTVLGFTPYTQGVPPTVGLLAASTIDGSNTQRVHVAAPTGDAYIMVYNRTGWPLTPYTLKIQLLPAGCFADAYETPPNNAWDTATPVPFDSVAGDPRLSVARLDLATMCSATDRDWFGFDMQVGDVVDAFVYYIPDEGNLDLFMYKPGPAGVNDRSNHDYDDPPGSIGLLHVTKTVASTDPVGTYLLEVEPYSVAGATTFNNVYFLEMYVQRSCINDDLEPSSALSPRAITVPFTRVPPTDPALALCGETDWYEMALTLGQTVTVCTTFTNSAGNIDLAVWNHAKDASSTSVSASNNFERVIYTADSDNTFYIQISMPAGGSTSYGLKVSNGVAGCP